MKKLLCFLLGCIHVVSLFAQQQHIVHHYADSLEALLQKPAADTTKASLLLSLSSYWSKLDSAKSVNAAQQAVQLDLDSFHKGVAWFTLGSAYYNYDINKAEESYKKADKLLSTYKTSEAYSYLSRTWANIGSLQQRLDNSREYINLLLTKAIPYAEKSGDSIRLAIQYSTVGIPFMNYRDYDKAIFYYTKAIQIFLHNQVRSLTVADCYSSMAKSYILNNDPLPAKPFLDSAWAILKNEKEGEYHTYYYCQEGLYYTHIKEWKKAEQSLEKGLLLAQRINSAYDIAQLLFGQIDLYNEQKNYTALKKVLLEFYNGPYNGLSNDRQNLLLGLARADKALGNINAAYDWLWQYSLLTDSIYKTQTNLQLSELETKYNYVQKEKELLQLSNKSQKDKFFLWLSVGLLLLALLAFIFLNKQRKIKAEGKLQLLRQQQQVAIAQALLDGEERERSRLSRDLHDGLGGLLAGIKINLSEIAQEGDTPLNKIIIQLDNSVTELRRIARNMMPEALLRSGLETSIKDLCQMISTDKMRVDVQVMNVNRNLNTQEQIIIYRIIQELLANVVKHAEATEVFVQCSQTGNIFYITVEDNGIGFDAARLNNKKGIGLNNVRNRVEFLHGRMDVQSNPSKGTIINIELQCSN